MGAVYDLCIVGGGPGGAAAAVYAARKQLKTIFITEAFGGQSTESAEIQNWIGTEKISGAELAKALENHVRTYASSFVDIKKGSRATNVQKQGGAFLIHTGKDLYEARAILITTGGTRKKLEVPGAAEFENKGVVYCASCDGPLFEGQDVVVVGGGNAGFETAAQLLAYTKSVTLLNRGNEFRADPVTVEKVLADPKMKALRNATPLEIRGEKFVKSVITKNETGQIEVPATGVFVEIGMLPNTELVANAVELDEYKRIIIDAKNQRTSCLGIWAAGDCTSSLYHQNNIAAGDAVKALEDIYLYLRAQ